MAMSDSPRRSQFVPRARPENRSALPEGFQRRLRTERRKKAKRSEPLPEKTATLAPHNEAFLVVMQPKGAVLPAFSEAGPLRVANDEQLQRLAELRDQVLQWIRQPVRRGNFNFGLEVQQ